MQQRPFDPRADLNAYTFRCKSVCTPSGVYRLMYWWNSFASKYNNDILKSWFSHVENDRNLPREGFLFWSQILSCDFKKIHFSSTNVMAIFWTLRNETIAAGCPNPCFYFKNWATMATL